ncbi:hypothetical protein BDV24DRAFT_140853 [Aspergillus arachidicola]|uniref:Uncharacterized protein n=1 Tax=Aspergillus arachidicola TaxID=656916 RepID=A0A5N6XUW8_9EURO|nr:hypothetical protein BDV24DRAFT_140853 [Aspergillus arachidicola]
MNPSFLSQLALRERSSFVPRKHRNRRRCPDLLSVREAPLWICDYLEWKVSARWKLLAQVLGRPLKRMGRANQRKPVHLESSSQGLASISRI